MLVIGIYLVILLFLVWLMTRMAKTRYSRYVMCAERCNHVDCKNCIDEEQCKLK